MFLKVLTRITNRAIGLRILQKARKFHTKYIAR